MQIGKVTRKGVLKPTDNIGKKKRRQIRSWIILALVVMIGVGAILYRQTTTRASRIEYKHLPCTAAQDVTVFCNGVIFYDGQSVQCYKSNGDFGWTYPVGAGAQFAAAGDNVVIWSGRDLHILNKNGNPTYNETMRSDVQFARISSRYCAVVIGEETAPQLIVKALDGTQVDEENEAFSGLMLTDIGFYGDSDQYMWTLAMDIFGVSINTVMNTFEVGRMNTGETSLGEFLAYRVVFENNRLRVFTTQQMYTYDYKMVPDLSRTNLVYGWQLLDYSAKAREDANLLLIPSGQVNDNLSITELRVITDTRDRRYTLPTDCVGAGISGKNIYALSADHLYTTNVDTQRFSSYTLQIPDELRATGLLGITADNRAVIFAGAEVYTATLPW